MLELPPPASEYIFGNSRNSEPAQPDLSTDNNLENTTENKSGTEDIASQYIREDYEGSILESNSSLEEEFTAPKRTLPAMPDREWYIDREGRSYLSEFIKNTQEKKVDVKSPEELEEELKKLELSEKKEKVEELREKIKTLKTQTPRLFKELRNEIEKLITQIEKEEKTTSQILEKKAVISDIITQIEDPNIYKEFLKNQGDPVEGIITKILVESTKIDGESKKIFGDDIASIAKIIAPIVKENAIKKIITHTGVQADLNRCNEALEQSSADLQFTLNRYDEALTQASADLQADLNKYNAALEESEENRYASFNKIIAQISDDKGSLINKYYKEDPYSIAGIIDQIQSEKADKNPIEEITTQISNENRIKEITTQIQRQNKIASQALKEDPLVQILIEHKKETSDKILSAIEEAKLSKKDEDEKGSAVVTSEIGSNISKAPTKKFKLDGEEVVEGQVVTITNLNPSGKNIDALFLNGKSSEIPKIETKTTKPSFFSRLLSGNTVPKYKENSKPQSDVVFFKLQENTAHPNEEQNLDPPTEEQNLDPPTEEQNLDPPTEDKKLESQTIKDIKESVIKNQYSALKLKEKKLADQLEEGEKGGQKEEQQALIKKEKSPYVKKLLLYAELIDKIPEQYSKSLRSVHQKIIKSKSEERHFKKTLDSLTELIAKEEEQKRIAEELAKEIVEEFARDILREIKEEEEQIALEIERAALEEENRIRNARPSIVKPQEERKLLEERIKDAQEKLNENCRKREDIVGIIKERLSSEYVDKKLEDDAEESTWVQLVIEAIIVDEAKKTLTEGEITEIENHLQQQSTWKELTEETIDENAKQDQKIDKKAFNLLAIKKALEKKLESERAKCLQELGFCEEFIVEDLKDIDTKQSRLNFFDYKNQFYQNAYPIFQPENETRTLELHLNDLKIKLQEKKEKLQLDNGQHGSRDDKYTNNEEPAEFDPQTTEPLGGDEEPFLQISLAQKIPKLGTSPVFDQASARNTDIEVYQTFQADGKQSNSALDSNQLLGEIQAQSSKKLESDIGNTNRYPDDVPVYDPYSGLFLNLLSIETLKALPPPASTEEVSSDPLTKVSIIALLRGIMGNSKEAQENTATSIDDIEKENLIIEVPPKDQIDEEDRIKKSFSNLFIRCLIEKVESSENKSCNQTTDNQNEGDNSITDDLNTNSKDPNKISFTEKEILECYNKISNHLASEYKKLLEKLNPSNPSDPSDPPNPLNPSDPSDPKKESDFLALDDSDIKEMQDPIIYCGVGIKMRLETQEIDGEEKHYLKIVEIFEDSALNENEHLNKKISEVLIKQSDNIDKYQSITDILKECDNNKDKFYVKISSIFRNPSEEKIGLKFQDEESLNREYEKKLFQPDKRKSMNLEDIKGLKESIDSRRDTYTPLLSQLSVILQ